LTPPKTKGKEDSGKRLPVSTMVSDDDDTVRGIDWGAAESEALPWNDGHVPEHLLHNDDPQCSCHLRFYPQHHGGTAQVHCVPHAASEQLAHAVYEYTTTEQQPSTWGSYVTLSQIRDYWDKKNYNDENDDNLRLLSQDDLALRAAASFVQHAQTVGLMLLGKQDDCSEYKYHGVAVWALAASVGSRVPYHLDYAELLRYETGTIVPPAVAGTWQVTSCQNMVGGDFCVALDGLEHYQRHGYKGALQPIGDDHNNDNNDDNSTTSCTVVVVDISPSPVGRTQTRSFK